VSVDQLKLQSTHTPLLLNILGEILNESALYCCQTEQAEANGILNFKKKSDVQLPDELILMER